MGREQAKDRVKERGDDARVFTWIKSKKGQNPRDCGCRDHLNTLFVSRFGAKRLSRE